MKKSLWARDGALIDFIGDRNEKHSQYIDKGDFFVFLFKI